MSGWGDALVVRAQSMWRRSRRTRACSRRYSWSAPLRRSRPFACRGSPPTGFQNEIILSNLNEPTGAVFAPDGRLIVIGATARSSSPSRAPRRSIRSPAHITNINISGGERGLVGIALDPGFASSGWFYVFYTAASPLRDTCPVHGQRQHRRAREQDGRLGGQRGRRALPPRRASSSARTAGCTSRPVTSSEVAPSPSRSPATGQDPPHRAGRWRAREQPFFDGAGPNLDAIWARGLRNPFRISFDRVSGRLYIGDVGGNSTSSSLEEVNIGVAGANYGWPVCEGNCGTAGMTNPWFTYPHGGQDASITGGFVYPGTQFPAEYRGGYFYGDYVQNWIQGCGSNRDGSIQAPFNFEPANGRRTGRTARSSICSRAGWLALLRRLRDVVGGAVPPGTVGRIRYLLTNQAPVAPSATPKSGPAPLGCPSPTPGPAVPKAPRSPTRGTWATAPPTKRTRSTPTPPSAPTPCASPSPMARRRRRRPAPDHRRQPAYATIDAPADDSTFRPATSSLPGSGSDVEDGALPASAPSRGGGSRHETHATRSSDHRRRDRRVRSPSRRWVTTSAATCPHEIICTVTDSDGLASSTAVSVVPEEVSLTLQTVPHGLTVLLDGVSRTTPITIDAAIGFQFQVEAPDQTVGGTPYVFANWSDGGARAHGLTIGTSDQTLTATFQPPPDTTPPAVSITAPAAGANVSGTTTVTATASDAVGVAGVQFLLDGASLGAEDTTSPYSVSWNTTTAANGPHTLTARARDAAGNTATSTAVNVVVTNGGRTVAAYGFDEAAGLDDRGSVRQRRHRHPRGRPGRRAVASDRRFLRRRRRPRVHQRLRGPRPHNRDDGGGVGQRRRGPIQLAVGRDQGTGDEQPHVPAGRQQQQLEPAELVACSPPTASGRSTAAPGWWPARGPPRHHLRRRHPAAVRQRRPGRQPGPDRRHHGDHQRAAHRRLHHDGAVLRRPHRRGADLLPCPECEPRSRPTWRHRSRRPGRRDPTGGVVTQPSGTLPAGTTQATLGVATSEPATCRYGTTPGVAYDAMTATFTTTGGTTHSSPVGPLADGTSYAYYVRCRDRAGNATTSDVAITFAVAAPPLRTRRRPASP